MVLDIIKSRWSPVSFSEKPVEDSKLHSIFEAARYAASSMNEQPWLFVLITRNDTEHFSNVLELLDDGNKIWAKNAYALIVCFTRTRHVYKGKPNRYAYYDTGMAVSNMLIQATSMGVSFHQMGGFSVEKAKNYFLPGDSIEPVVIIAAGYQGDGKEIPPGLFKRDSVRKPRKDISDFVFRNRLNIPAF